MASSQQTRTPSNSVAVRDDGRAALALSDGQVQWTPAQDAALAQLGIADASDGDKQVFLHVSQRTGLDPFSRQIYMIPRSEKKGNGWVTKWTIQTGIDGWRVIRARAERREGVRGRLSRAVFYDPEGNEYKVWVQPRPPVACEITYTAIDAAGNETPYTSVLRYAEYCQVRDGKPVAQWAMKPAHMLEKCVEADVYRKAFPQDFSGIELEGAALEDGEVATVQQQEARQNRPTGAQIRQQARQRQQVTAEVVAAAADSPVEWPGWATEGHLAQCQRLDIGPDALARAMGALAQGDPERLTEVLSEYTVAEALLAAIDGQEAGE